MHNPSKMNTQFYSEDILQGHNVMHNPLKMNTQIYSEDMFPVNFVWVNMIRW